MKLLRIAVFLILSLSCATLFATETVSEKAQAKSNDIKRDANEAVNRVQESACTGSDAECAKQKIGNRAEEAKDTIKDKSSEMKNKMD